MPLKPFSVKLGLLIRATTAELAAAEAYLRVIDESGEDYLYPGSYFVPIEIPNAADRDLLIAC